MGKNKSKKESVVVRGYGNTEKLTSTFWTIIRPCKSSLSSILETLRELCTELTTSLLTSSGMIAKLRVLLPTAQEKDE